jgi:hypothetical protein
MSLDSKVPELPISKIEYKKAPDFASAYANNVFLESSLWDLKLIFGQNDQQLGVNAVVQHTAITIPWAQIKVLKYFLDSHLAAHEIMNGRIIIPLNVIPPVLPEAPKELLKDNPKLPEVVAVLKSKYDSFIAINPEAAPIVTDAKQRKQ